MARRDHRRIRPLGLATTASLVIVFFALMIINGGEYAFSDLTMLRADFRTVTGLRHGSPVQLAGVQVGRVSDIDFVKVAYECDPLTEDIGRFGAGRTNDCDERLFCSPLGLCADLEAFAGKGYNTLCHSSEECAAEEICVTGEFRRRARKVPWPGPTGVCAKFQTSHWRTQVRMEVLADTLEMIRTDSRASIASNSVLGDQLVGITPGHADPLAKERRIQTQSSLREDIDLLVERVERSMESADVAIEALNNVLHELQDARTIGALESLIANLEIITRRIAHGDGLVGGLGNDSRLRDDTGLALGSLAHTAAGLESAIGTANHILVTADANIEPVTSDSRATLMTVNRLFVDLANPRNKSLVAKLLRDPDGRLARHVLGIASNVSSISLSASEITRKLDEGEGTLGRLVNDPAVARDVGLLLSGIASHDVIKALGVFVLQRNGYDVAESRRPAGP